MRRRDGVSYFHWRRQSLSRAGIKRGRVFHGVKEARTKIRKRARWIDREEYHAWDGERERERDARWRETMSREKESNGRLSGAKWSEVEWRSWRPVISARFMLFRVFASGSAGKKGGRRRRRRWLRPRNINTLNSLSTLPEPEHMLTSHNYALLLFHPLRVGERTTGPEMARPKGSGRLRATASLPISNNKTAP